MQGLSRPKLRTGRCDSHSVLLAKSSHMAEPRFKGLENDSTSSEGIIEEVRGMHKGKSEELGLLIQLITDPKNNATVHSLQAWVTASHAVPWTRESPPGSFGGT